MKASRVRPLMPAHARWYPEREQLDKFAVMANYHSRIALIVEMAHADNAIAVEPITRSLVIVTKELGGFYCVGNPAALGILEEMLPTLIRLDDTLIGVGTEAAKRARAILAAVAAEARRWVAARAKIENPLTNSGA